MARGFASAAAAAQHFSWTVSTYVSHENGTRGLNADAAERYGKAFGIPAAELLGLTPASDVNEVQVMMAASLGVWRDARVDAEQKGNKNTVTIPRVEGIAVRYAVPVADDSVNKTLISGSFAICVPVEADEPAQPGLFYHVERIRDGLVERTIRRAERGGDGKLSLRTHSTSAALLSVVSYPAKEKDGEVKILGRVIGAYTPLTPLSN